jgi:glucose-6-phosphate isomerase
MPVLQALVGIWNRNFLGSASLAPYHQWLRFFPAYLQQLDMESNGKRITRDGTPSATCPAIWGESAPTASTPSSSCCTRAPMSSRPSTSSPSSSPRTIAGHQEALLANCFAQSEAFMRGKDADEVRADLQAQVCPKRNSRPWCRTKPSTATAPAIPCCPELSPHALGAMIALYEHKTFVQGAIWGINSFDQWGVELGKVLAKTILGEQAEDAPEAARHDASTSALIALARQAAQAPAGQLNT